MDSLKVVLSTAQSVTYGKKVVPGIKWLIRGLDGINKYFDEDCGEYSLEIFITLFKELKIFRL